MLKISEKTFDETILTQDGWVLDLGADKDYPFAKALTNMGMKSIAVDPEINMSSEVIDNLYLWNNIVSAKEGKYTIHTYKDIDANSIMNPTIQDCMNATTGQKEVFGITIDFLMKFYEIDQFELIKMNIEGAEYEILMSIDKPIAKQITVSFHDFRGYNPYYPDNERYYKELFEKIGKWYNIVQHECTDHPGFPQGYGRNYWDSLFVLKEEYWLK